MLIDKEEPKDKGLDIFFGCLFIAEAVRKMRDTLGWILSAHKPAEKATKATGDSKLKIRYMSPEEEMRYLISTHDDKRIFKD